MRGTCDDSEEDLNWEPLSPRVLRYKRGSHIPESGIMEVRM